LAARRELQKIVVKHILYKETLPLIQHATASDVRLELLRTPEKLTLTRRIRSQLAIVLDARKVQPKILVKLI
jgi:hypothetical protein